ncbi:MAG TPA: hypothetical protein DCP32_11420 [Anaerolineaceae bacterium]|nr:hypothetical protein [Anaerolineaceae bacterium]
MEALNSSQIRENSKWIIMGRGSSRAARELISVVVMAGWIAHRTLSKLLDFGAAEKIVNQIR